MVEHIVLVKFSEEATAEKKAAMAEELRGLKGKIPGILDISVGDNFSARAQGFDRGLVVRLENEEALAGYSSHPEHVRVANDHIKPIIKDILAVDYTF